MWRTIVIVHLLVAAMNLSGSGQSAPIKFTSLGTKDGLLSNSINAILKDRYGWMWFATNDGLNKFDGSNFTVYRHRVGDSTSLRANEIVTLHEDKAGNLWVGTSGGALSLYDRKRDVFINYPRTGEISSLSPSSLVRSICSDDEGKIWIAQFDAPYVLDPVSSRIERLDLTPFAANPSDKISLYCVFGDSRHRMWVGTDRGLFLYERAARRFRQFRHMGSDSGSLVQDDARVLAEDRSGNLWVGTNAGMCRLKEDGEGRMGFRRFSGKDPEVSGGVINAISVDKDGFLWVGTSDGLRVINPITGHSTAYVPEKGNLHSLTSRAIRCIFIDNQGIYWVGTYRGGVNKYDKNLNLFDGKLSDAFHEGGTESTIVTSFAERPDGNLWLGTDGGGLYEFDRAKDRLTRIPMEGYGRDDLAVLALKRVGRDELYIGTWGKGILIQNIRTGTTRQVVKGKGPGDLNANDIFCLAADREGKVWAGTNGSGINVLKNGRVITRFTPQPEAATDVRLPVNGYIRAIEEDRDGNIWIGSHGGGVAVYNQQSRVFRVYNQELHTLPSNKVQSLLLDSQGRMWIGTYGGGLVRYDRAANRMIVYDEKDGLQNTNVYQVVEDTAGLIWVTTNTGISSLDPKTGVFRNFTPYNGIQNNNFVHQSGIRTTDGELFFGGQQGFNYFYPATLTTNRNVPAIVLTDLKVANRSVVPGKGAPITEQIATAGEIRLNYKQNFALSYVALNYTLPKQNLYAYRLDGFDKDWNYVGSQNTAYYTNLDPGEYVFRVKASNNDGVWSTTDSSIRIYVKPPIWRTAYAYLFYVLFIGGLLLYSRHLGLVRVKKKFALEQERQETRRVQELDQMKLKFLTNLSHEFRTPISLIMGPVDQLLARQKDEMAGEKLQLIKRNSRRLLNLVNQLLDFRKMEEHELRLQLTEGEIVSFVRDVCQSFADLSQRKNIGFGVETRVDRLYVWFDKDKIERILFNLLSNAFKFTLEGGRIGVVLDEEGVGEDGRRVVSIKVIDTGIGIPADKKEMIFERFFQSSSSSAILNPGTGIGLSITKEFVRLHGGTIDVESEAGKGSVFTIRLPLAAANNIVPPPVVVDEVKEPVGPAKDRLSPAGKPAILLVEDNEDFRFYLKDNLKSKYTIIEAANGKEGWQKALSGHPDLIVSDVSMPYMDGITFTRRLKEDKRTAHIPVIMLTALTEQGEQLAGLETGANDYITKPFDFELLHAKIRSLLGLSQQLKSTFTRQINVVKPDGAEKEVESADEKLMRQIVACIEANFDDPKLSVEFLSRELAMSRTSLYNKMLELTGQTPVEYIRSFKLEKAAALLERNDLTISEIAYKAGFSTPNYFARAFKAKYKMGPSEYASQVRKQG